MIGVMFTQKDLVKVMVAWMPLAFVATVLSGLIYVTVQQDMRQGANDPQIQLAESAAHELEKGMPVAVLVPRDSVDLSSDLSPFVIVYDKSGNVVASQATLSGKTPSLPSGVLDAVKNSGEKRFTWQPQEGVRIAAVVTSYSASGNNGYVLAGRSLREVEVREDSLHTQVLMLWLVSVLGSLVLIGVLVWVKGWTKVRS